MIEPDYRSKKPIYEQILDMYWDGLAEDHVLNWAFWAVIAGVLILISYIADQKKTMQKTVFMLFLLRIG